MIDERKWMLSAPKGKVLHWTVPNALSLHLRTSACNTKKLREFYTNKTTGESYCQRCEAVLAAYPEMGPDNDLP